jgi:hypothetical protein
MQQTIEALNRQSTVGYGEDMPLEASLLVHWCISRFEAWGVAAGMETFKDQETPGVISLILGGKVLVVDVEFAVDAVQQILSITSVKTSYAIPDSTNTEGSTSLDGFLADSMRVFVSEVQKADGVRDPLEASRLGFAVLEQLKYLVTLDKLAESKTDGGIRWFVDVDKLCSTLEGFADKEAKAVGKALHLSVAPLDIVLLRSHALPLPYLTIPSISFLIHISPLAYLSLLKNTQSTGSTIDIPIQHIRQYMSVHRIGVSTATLRIASSSPRIFPPLGLSDMTIEPTRPKFPLTSTAIDHTFPQLTAEGSAFWILDFTDNGQRRGLVMSQSRMREIELVVNPISNVDDDDHASGMMAFGTGSWVDLLVSTALGCAGVCADVPLFESSMPIQTMYLPNDMLLYM